MDSQANRHPSVISPCLAVAGALVGFAALPCLIRSPCHSSLLPRRCSFFHRHALESVFGFLTLAELSSMLTAAPIFAPPIVSMRGLDAAITRVFNIPSASSPLLRHVGCVDAPGDRTVIHLSHAHIRSLALLPNLRVLRMRLDSDADVMSELPARPTELRLSAGITRLDPNLVVRSVSALVLLTKLSLTLPWVPVDCSPLQSLPALRDLEIDSESYWSLEQLDQIRAMPNLESVDIHASTSRWRCCCALHISCVGNGLRRTPSFSPPILPC